MPRVDPPKRTDTCPGCKGSKKNNEGQHFVARQEACHYCDGIGKVTNHKYKTLLRYFKSGPTERRRNADGSTLH